MSNLSTAEHSNTFHVTKEDVRKMESRESRRHADGSIPKNSETAAMQSIVDQQHKNPEENLKNLPLPEQPEKASDWQSFDARKTGTGSGAVQSTVNEDVTRDPIAADSSARVDGEQVHRVTKP